MYRMEIENIFEQREIQCLHKNTRYPSFCAPERCSDLSRNIKQTLGINFKYRYLRHTYGTRLAEQNTPSHLLCNQMGHASSKVTEKYYLAISEHGKDILKDNLEGV